MNNAKHICQLEYCKKHYSCIFKNAEDSLKTDPRLVVLGEFKYEDKIICYEKQGQSIPEIKATETRLVNRCANIYCGTLSDITRHHLIPRPYRRGLCTPTDKIPLCRTCHDRVHRLKTNKQLAKYYNTREAVIELLASDVDFRKERFINVSNEEYQYQTMVA